MSCQQVPTAPAFNPYPRSVQVGEFEVAIGGGIWVAIGEAISPAGEHRHGRLAPLIYNGYQIAMLNTLQQREWPNSGSAINHCHRHRGTAPG